jgi:hypothetical protein
MISPGSAITQFVKKALAVRIRTKQTNYTVGIALDGAVGCDQLPVRIG